MNTQKLQSDRLFRAGIIGGVSLVLGILFDYLFYGSSLGISFPIYIVLIVTGMFAITKSFKTRLNKEVFWLMVPLLFFSAMVTIRASELLTILNVTFALLLLLLILKVSLGDYLKTQKIVDYFNIVFLPFQFFRPLSFTLSDIYTLRREESYKRTFRQLSEVFC